MADNCSKTQCIRKIFSLFFYLLMVSFPALECNGRDDPDIQADYADSKKSPFSSSVRAAAKLTSNFEAMADRLSSEMKSCCKKEVVEMLENIPSDQLTVINAELRDGIVSRLQNFFSSDERVIFLRRLFRGEVADQHDEITCTTATTEF